MKKIGLTLLILAVAVLAIVGIEKVTPPRPADVAIPVPEALPPVEPAVRKPNIEQIRGNLREFDRRVNIRAEPVTFGSPAPRTRGSRSAPPVTQRRTREK